MFCHLDVCLSEEGRMEHPQCDYCDPGPIVQQNKQRRGEAGEAAGPEGRALDTSALDPDHPFTPPPPLLVPPIQPTPLT